MHDLLITCIVGDLLSQSAPPLQTRFNAEGTCFTCSFVDVDAEVVVAVDHLAFPNIIAATECSNKAIIVQAVFAEETRGVRSMCILDI